MEMLNKVSGKSWVDFSRRLASSANGTYSRHKGNKVRRDVGGGCYLRLFF